jgi:hypothetical protein
MAIVQLTTANTFQQWLVATQALITTANTLTDGNGASFLANTILDITGTGSQLNVRNNAGINTLFANNIIIASNISTLNVTSTANIGGDVLISGNLTVSGNITLDTIGFDDLMVNGSATIANTLSVTGNTSLVNATITYGNISTANVVLLAGSANTAVYANITRAQAFATSAGTYGNTAFDTANSAFTAANNAADQAVAFSIALG